MSPETLDFVAAGALTVTIVLFVLAIIDGINFAFEDLLNPLEEMEEPEERHVP